jgi:1-acylglycerone phosphate reductase
MLCDPNRLTQQLMIKFNSCASPGIGNALAREFHANGCRVIASARNKQAIVDLEELGMETLSLNVCDEESIQNAAEEVEKLVGERGLDVLVNNA